MKKRIYSADEGIEVAGTTTLSILNNIGSVDWQELREKHDLVEIDETQWYPINKLLNLMNDIVEKYGTQPFVAMGMKIAEQSEFPEEMLNDELSLVQLLEGWQAHYEVNHRGGTLPPVETKKLTDKHYQLVLLPNHTYPYDLVYGMAYGFGKRLLPNTVEFTVQYLDKHTPYNNDDGNVIVDVLWKPKPN